MVLDSPNLYVTILYAGLSGWALISLWRREPGLIRGLLWSGVIILPFLGPLFYAAFFNPPPPLQPQLRKGVHPYIGSGGKGIMDDDHGVESKTSTENKGSEARLRSRRLRRSPNELLLESKLEQAADTVLEKRKE